MHKFAVAIGVGAFALGFIAGYAVDARKHHLAAATPVVVATVDMTRMTKARPIETPDANGALAADYSWQHWPSVTDF